MRIDTDKEATFSIGESGDPLCIKFHAFIGTEREVSEGSSIVAWKPSLRIAPVYAGFLLSFAVKNEYQASFEGIPAYSSVLLKLAIIV